MLVSQSFLMPFPPLPTYKSKCDTISTLLLMEGAIFVVKSGAGSLHDLDSKLARRSASLNIQILQKMLSIVEDLPRLQLYREFGSEVHIRSDPKRFTSESIIEEGQHNLARIFSPLVRGTLRMVITVLRSLYWLDKKLHQRSPRILTTLRSILNNAQNTERLVGELKHADESDCHNIYYHKTIIRQ